MRIRFWLYLIFGIFSILPLLSIGLWVQKSSIDSEINNAGKGQLVLAETHADTISRYLAGNFQAFDEHYAKIVKSGFSQLTYEKDRKDDLGDYCVFDLAAGQVVQRYSAGGDSQKFIDSAILKELSASSSQNQTSISRMIRKPDGNNMFLVHRRSGDKLVMAELSTRFFTDLASTIRVGNSGHAAIFDSEGNLIAHPNSSWQAIGKNIASLKPVEMASEGKNGIVEFLSPATQSQMLAGVANIPPVNWGLMIPRSMNEIVGESHLVTKTASIIFMFVLAAILLGCIMVSNIISGPLERLTAIVRSVGKGENIDELNLTPNLLTPTENRELEESFSMMASRLRSTHNKMKVLAFTDSVTGLPNRDAFSQILENSLAELAKRDLSGMLLLIDVGNFREINDSHGHNVGDQVLRTIGSRMSNILEILTGCSPAKAVENHLDVSGIPIPCIARFRGNEFVIFLPENNGLSILNKITDQILDAVRSPVSGLHTNIKLYAQIGMASFPEHGLTHDQLIKRADIAVYHAKKSNIECIKSYGDGTGELTSGEIRRDVHLAIKNNEMELYYQPKVNTLSNDVNSVEALIRWFHPTRGLVSPADFIPVIEGSDITNELGEWVVRRACIDMKTWESQGRKLNVAVNIAARQFCSAGFVEHIHAIVLEEECDPSRFEIEVTEETALSGDGKASEVIGKLQHLGFKVSLDDYGRGYSNLTRLSELRVNTIKIDGPLTARITRDERTRVIFEATINMAKGLNCKTVAEGVETAEEANILRRLGCTELQGFYFATPMQKKNLVDWIAKREKTLQKNLHADMAIAS